MTLNEWKQKWDYVVTTHSSGAMVLPDDLVCGARSELWHLSDYVVSSVTGGSVWLIKRETA